MKHSVIALVLAFVGVSVANAQDAGKKTFEECTYRYVEASLDDGKLLERSESNSHSRMEKTKYNGATADKFIIELSGDVEKESFVLNEDGSKTKTYEMQFSTVGKINRERRDLGGNRTFQLDERKSVQTAKGDFNFRLPGGVLSKTKEVATTTEFVLFDDGKTSKFEYIKFNGQPSEESNGEYEESEFQDGEYTVTTSKLKAPFSYNDLKTVVESDDTICRKKNLN